VLTDGHTDIIKLELYTVAYSHVLYP